MRLSPRDFDLLQKALLELHDHREIEEFWRAIGYRRWGIERVLSVGVASRGANAAGIRVTRSGKDFT